MIIPRTSEDGNIESNAPMAAFQAFRVPKRRSYKRIIFFPNTGIDYRGMFKDYTGYS